MSVCLVDGVEVAENRARRLVHLGDLPGGVDPDHDIVLADPAALEAEELARQDVHTLAMELVAHHTVMHPMSDCPFSMKLAAALRAKR